MRFTIGCFVVAASLLSGCGGDDPEGSTTTTDTGTAADTGSTPPDTGGTTTDTGSPPTDSAVADASSDTGPAFDVVNGCAEADYVDATTDATKRALDPWDTTSGKKCVKIKKGQEFKWVADLSIHPLEPFGGDSPSPITLMSVGSSITVSFNSTGTFGYHCANHPSMLGAILVVP